MPITTADLKAAIANIQSGIAPVGAELNELDGKLGDGDLGVTLINGFKNISDASDDLSEDVGMALFRCAKLMTQVSGSSFGTLMATSLMAAGKLAKGKLDLDQGQIPDLLQAAQDAMIARGRASLGDNTILDSTDAIIAVLTVGSGGARKASSRTSGEYLFVALFMMLHPAHASEPSANAARSK